MGLISVHVVPRANRTEVAGVHGDAIRIRVAAPPVGGAANEELIQFVAQTLRVPRSVVRIAAGQSGRRKQVEVAGVESDMIRKRLLTADG
jgi:uncharacterized protein (TIGR00251 family)